MCASPPPTNAPLTLKTSTAASVVGPVGCSSSSLVSPSLTPRLPSSTSHLHCPSPHINDKQRPDYRISLYVPSHSHSLLRPPHLQEPLQRQSARPLCFCSNQRSFTKYVHEPFLPLFFFVRVIPLCSMSCRRHPLDGISPSNSTAPLPVLRNSHCLAVTAANTACTALSP